MNKIIFIYTYNKDLGCFLFLALSNKAAVSIPILDMFLFLLSKDVGGEMMC